MFRYLKFPLLSLVLGLAAASLLSWLQNHDSSLVLQSLLTVTLLSVLEISLSFDNAVVNATVLKKMSPVWKKRFLIWGMLIAVFGMRFIFPIIIVSIAGHLSFFSSIQLALDQPQKYADLMTASHFAISSYGGMFLLMVGLNYFMDAKKRIHWIGWVEKPLSVLARIPSVDIILTLVIVLTIASNLTDPFQDLFLRTSLYGILTFLSVRALSILLEDEESSLVRSLSSGFGFFLYLEVLDASFSFDGVIGAFAITKQIYEIIIGLGIGAFFVRGLTIYLVDNKKIDQYMYLEHGAFYALLALSFFMLTDHFFHFSQWITGLTGAVVLFLSVFWSIYVNRKA